MSATLAQQPPQRVCPRCSTIARTTEARCPFCGHAYRRRSPLLGFTAVLLVTAVAVIGATLGGTALMLSTFGDELETELDDQVEVVQRDLDRDVRRIERSIERELDERLPPPTGP